MCSRLKAPGDERGEPAGLVLQLAQPHQVLDALVQCLDRPIHHRRGRAQPAMVRVAHHVQPFIGSGFAVAVQEPANAIDEDLRSPAGNAVEAGGNQPIDDFGHSRAATGATGESLPAATARAV